MCFAEFIGYTCGHSSMEVVRPCPQTTHFMSNPICSVYARRPVLLPTMCPACSRMIHGRAVLIMEWEHHWMHERNVCGCDVVFPDIMRPRVVGHGIGMQVSTSDQLIGLSDEHVTTADGRAAVPAIFESGNDGGVAVRLTSLFGAEWIQDHRQLHVSGRCGCPGTFETYQGPKAYMMTSEDYAYLEVGNTFQDEPKHNSNTDVTPTITNPTPRPRSSASDPGYAPSREWSESCVGPFLSPPVTPRHLDVRAEPDDVSSSQTVVHPPFMTDTPPIHPHRGAGAIHAATPMPGSEEGGPSTNVLFNSVCATADNQIWADFQSVEYPPEAGRKLLVGLPIGAGPEGTSHAPPWEECVMRWPRDEVNA